MKNTRKIVGKAEAQEVLMPYYDLIVNAIKSAFNDYLRVVNRHFQEDGRAEFSKRTIAGMVHDFTRTRIKDLLNDDPNIEVREFNKVFGIKIHDKVFIRFKKLNNDYSTSNIQTKQTIQYANQLEIDGFPVSPTLLYAGYMPDETWTSIKNIYLLCKQGKNLLWQIDLNGTAEQAKFDFVYNTIETEETIASRVKLKTKEIKRIKTGS